VVANVRFILTNKAPKCALCNVYSRWNIVWY